MREGIVGITLGVRRNPSTGSVTTSASESGSLERARAQLERRKRAAHAPPPLLAPLPPEAGDGHVGSCRVENTRVNPDSLIDEIIASTDLKKAVEDNAESEYPRPRRSARPPRPRLTGLLLVAASGLQLFISRDGTAELGSRQRQQLARRDYQRVVLHPHDDRCVRLVRVNGAVDWPR